MRFRNLVKDKRTGKPAPIYFPYAGDKDKRGREVLAGALSRDLPPQRFFDPLLQRDWKMGAIEVLFNEQDKAVLGDAIKGLIGEEVEVSETEQPAAKQEMVVVSKPALGQRKRGRPRKTDVVIKTKEQSAPVVATPSDAVSEVTAVGTVMTEVVPAVPEPVVEAVPSVMVEVPPVKTPPQPVLALPVPPRPALAPTRTNVPMGPPSAAPKIGKHTIHAPQDVRNQTGIQNMKNMSASQFAGLPAGIGLADLKRQNNTLPVSPRV